MRPNPLTREVLAMTSNSQEEKLDLVELLAAENDIIGFPKNLTAALIQEIGLYIFTTVKGR